MNSATYIRIWQAALRGFLFIMISIFITLPTWGQQQKDGNLQALTTEKHSDKSLISKRLQDAINKINHLPPTIDRISLRTTLQCQLYWYKSAQFSPSEIEKEKKTIRRTLKTKNYSNVYDEYLDNFKMYMLYDMGGELQPATQNVKAMMNIAVSLGQNNNLIPHATRIGAEFCVRTSRFELGKDFCNRLIESIDLRKQNPESAYSAITNEIAEYRAKMCKLVCIFETEHYVEASLMADCKALHDRNNALQNTKDHILLMYPIYLAISEGRMYDAYNICHERMRKMSNSDQHTYDYEADAAVMTSWKSGHLEEALDLTEKQIKAATSYIKRIDEMYLHETGYDQDLSEIDLHSQELLRQQQEASDTTERNRRALQEITDNFKNDSLAFAKMLEHKHNNLTNQNKQNENTTKEKDAAHEDVINKQRTYLFIVLIVSILFLTIATPYFLKLRKLNKRLKEENQRLQIITDKANQSNRLKMFFLQNTSHDLRNPLGAIVNLTQMMQTMVSESKDDSMTDIVQLVSENASALHQLMDNILDISAIESGRFPIEWRVCSPTGIVQEIVSAHQLRNSKNLNIQLIDNLPENFTLNTDEKRLRQLISELLTNAYKFTDQGSITIKLNNSQDTFYCTVEDTGRGIPKGKEKTVFQRFLKLDKYIPGTGLGLSLCKIISTKLFGNIKVDSSYEDGARLVFEQPLLAHLYAKNEKQNEVHKIKPQNPKRWWQSRTSAVCMIITLLPWVANNDTSATKLQLFPNQPVIRTATTQHILNDQNTKSIYDSLLNVSQHSRNANERIIAYQNLLDVCLSKMRDSMDVNITRMYKEAEQQGRTDLMLEAARNSYTVEGKREMLKRIAQLPATSERRSVETALRIGITMNEQYYATSDEREAWMNNNIKMMQHTMSHDLYERFYQLFCLCYVATGGDQSIILREYIKELETVAEKLDSKQKHLENIALLTVYFTYLCNNDKQLAANAILKLLSNLQILHAQYQAKGRYYRDFCDYYVNYLCDLYCCSSVLTEEQLQQCYDQIKECCKWHPELKYSNSICGVCAAMVMAMHEERWLDAAKFVDPIVDNLDQNMTQSETRPLNAQQSLSLLLTMKDIYQHTGNLDKLLRTRILTCEHARRMIRNMWRNNYQHLGIRMEMFDMEMQNAEMQAQHQLKLIENEQLRIDIEGNKLRNSEKILANQKEQYRIDSLTEVAIHTQKRMEKELIDDKMSMEKAKRIMLWTIFVITLAASIAMAYALFHLHRKSRRMERLKGRLASEMERAKLSNEERTNFLQGIRHEVGTPLNIIMGMTEQISAMTEGNNEEMQTISKMIRENGDQLLALVNDILDLSQLQSGNYNLTLKSYNVCETCNALMVSVMHNCPHNVEMTEIYQIPNHETFVTDITRFRQLITNLLTNACKYTEEGSIQLEVSRREDNNLCFAVTDTGSGIAPDDAERIFNRFEKLGSSKKGTGLGLNICRTIATNFGGELYLDTKYQQGARFVFVHPQLKENSETESVSEANS